MDKDLMYGLSVTFVIWVSALAWSSSRLVYNNWNAFLGYREAAQDDLAKMSLWLAIPLWMIGVLFQRVVALWHVGLGNWSDESDAVAADIHVGITLIAAALSLFWAYDRTYGHALGRILWCHHMWFGVLAGVVTSVISWVR